MLDCSAILALCFEDEDEEYAEYLLDYFTDGTAISPEIWPLEISNVLLAAVRRKRLVKAEANHFFHLLSSLPVDIIAGHSTLERYGALCELAGEHHLSAYDASYLALALERDLPLATLDRQLIEVATSVGVGILGP